jgi:predicted TIM-barrel fold metal-dependent hydrolase
MAFQQQELYTEFSTYAESRPKISTHCHQLHGRELRAFDLEALLRNSYVNWCGVPWDNSFQSHQDLFERIKFNSFFVWLQKSLNQLYEENAPLTASSWQAWSERIQAAYREPSHPRDILAGRCGYKHMLLDAYWDPGSDNGAPDFFAPVYRVNAFFFGYSADAADHDGNNPYILSPHAFILDLDEYIGWVRENILTRQAAGCVALKIPIAYDRGLDFNPVPDHDVQQAFARLTSARRLVQSNRPPTDRALPSNAPSTTATGQSRDANPQDIKTFQDFLFFQICRLAGELDLPIQIHTGMGQARRTSAAYLQEAIQAFPGTRFVLLHCSYPWTQDVNMLVDKFPNVSADLSMLPLLSTRAGKAMLHDLIERATRERIFWGCDTWTAEESFGALLAFRHTLASVLAEKVLDGYLTREDAFQITDDIFFNNPQRFYKFVSLG